MPGKDREKSKHTLPPRERDENSRREAVKTEDGKDQVDEAVDESFPASDPPSSTPGHA